MQQVGEESRAQPDSPRLVPTTSTLQASILGQVGEEWPSCFPFFFPLNPLLLTDAITAMESFSPMGCCWVPPQMLHWTLRGAQPLMAGSGPVAPPPLSPHLAKPPVSHCRETSHSPLAQGGREEVGMFPVHLLMCVKL